MSEIYNSLMNSLEDVAKDAGEIADKPNPINTKQGPGRDRVQKPKQGQGRDTVRTPLNNNINLPQQQLKIYKWFLKNGLKGTFNKPLIESETKITDTTIRKTLRRFKDLDIIKLSYDDSLKMFEYSINTDILIKNIK